MDKTSGQAEVITQLFLLKIDHWLTNESYLVWKTGEKPVKVVNDDFCLPFTILYFFNHCIVEFLEVQRINDDRMPLFS